MLRENQQRRRGTPRAGVGGQWLFCALALLAVLLGTTSATEAQTTVTLAWDANTESDLAGYQVSYGTQTRVYSTIVDVGNVTSFPFTLTSGTVYYFAVKAYNSSSPRQYSPYSLEVSTSGITGVVKTTPVLTWATPTSITSGTALGPAQLNATANVPGTFVYIPAAGTVLAEGTHALTVFFTPADGVNYSTATKTTSLVVLASQEPPANQVPFGAFDTPANGAANLSGSIAVTGWALDEVGVDRVEIWRDLVAGEDASHAYTTDPSHPAFGKVFIANPTFVAGARSDVERLYPTYPSANRAGWGYLLMSWGLWNQGNGTFQLYAYAFDVDGHGAPLGTKTVTIDNAHAAKPFGAIDTPAYGEKKSGIFYNFGWAVTPVEPSSCRIENGGVLVSIDSRPLAPVMYGDARSDIAAAFPGLLNSTNASGAFAVDTTLLANGLHQIGWLVTDNCGRQDGVGSRFFTVLNGAGAARGDGTAGGTPLGVASETFVTSVANDAIVTSAGIVSAGRPDRSVSTNEVAARPSPTPLVAIAGTVAVRHHGGDWQDVEPDGQGRHAVEMHQGGRIEVQLPLLAAGEFGGYQIAARRRRALPLGSSFDAKAGIFYWQPDSAFLGPFDLVFEAAGSEVVRLRVVVK